VGAEVVPRPKQQAPEELCPEQGQRETRLPRRP
jgi:hypothetical protein